MARGGYRPGAGRPKGVKSAKSPAPTEAQTAAAEQTLQTAPRRSKRHKSALDFAMSVINDPDATLDAKIRLAVAALPFQSPKVAAGGVGKKEAARQAAERIVTGQSDDDGGWGDDLLDPNYRRPN